MYRHLALICFVVGIVCATNEKFESDRSSTNQQTTAPNEPASTSTQVSLPESLRDPQSPPEVPTFLGSRYVIPNLMSYNDFRETSSDIRKIFDTLEEVPGDLYKQIDEFVKRLLPQVENLSENNLVRKFVINADTILRFFEYASRSEENEKKISNANQSLITLVKLMAPEFLKIMNELGDTANRLRPDVPQIVSPTLRVHPGKEEMHGATLASDSPKAKTERIHFGPSTRSKKVQTGSERINEADVSQTIVHHAEGKTTQATQTDLSFDSKLKPVSSGDESVPRKQTVKEEKPDRESAVASPQDEPLDGEPEDLLQTVKELMGDETKTDPMKEEADIKPATATTVDTPDNEPEDLVPVENLMGDEPKFDPIPSSASDLTISDMSKVTKKSSSQQKQSVGAQTESKTTQDESKPTLTPVTLSEAASVIPGLLPKDEVKPEEEFKGEKSTDTSSKR